MNRHRAAALLVVLVLGAHARVARADTPSAPASVAPTPAELETARTSFEAGEAAFTLGDFVVALAEFREAYAAVPRDPVRFNIAVCLERLERFAEARTEYEAAAASAAVGDAQRAEARAHADALADRTAEIVVDGAGPADRVLVEGTERCALPCRVFVGAGKVRVRVAGAAGVSRVETTVDATPGALVHVVVPAASRAPLAPSGEPETEGRAGWLTVVGASVFAVGAGGTIGFGLRADDLHDDYVANPTVATRDDGLVMKGLTNASIAIGCVGALLVVGDLLLFRTGETLETQDAVKADARGLTVRF